MKNLILILILSGCTVKSAIKDQYQLKNECYDLQPELQALASKQLPKVIQEKVKECRQHGFWKTPKPKPIHIPEIESGLKD